MYEEQLCLILSETRHKIPPVLHKISYDTFPSEIP